MFEMVHASTCDQLRSITNSTLAELASVRRRALWSAQIEAHDASDGSAWQH
jgi:hypothetical protein